MSPNHTAAWAVNDEVIGHLESMEFWGGNGGWTEVELAKETSGAFRISFPRLVCQRLEIGTSRSRGHRSKVVRITITSDILEKNLNTEAVGR